MLAALVRRGHHVLVPFGEGQPYDLVVDLGGADFLRVQCKTAWPQKGCLVFNPHMTDHGRGRRSYAVLADEIDRWTAGSLREILRAGSGADEAALTLA